MFDTNVTIVGNVLNAPEWRRTANTNSLVANFKIASTARRLDRESGRWIDGNSLRVRVNCWRKLAEGVASSVTVGDPVVVVGRLYTRDWTDTQGNQRTMYELEAVAVGHDLSRGRGTFARSRPSLATNTVEDDDSVRGEATVPVPLDQVPVRLGNGLFDDDPDFPEIPAMGAYDPIAEVRGGGFEPEPYGEADAGGPPAVPHVLATADSLDVPTRPATASSPAASPSGDLRETNEAGRTSGLSGRPSSSDDDSDAAEDGPRRPRRSRGRTPVPA